jgi:hypothetical protein
VESGKEKRDQPPVRGSDLFEPFERLLTLRVLGKEGRVPENNVLLRGLQYLDPDEVSYGDFCWNGDCLNCRVTLRRCAVQEEALSCQTVVREGDEIVEAGPEIRKVLRSWLSRP